ncbi:glycosyltransferase family 4 protein [Cesiribacter sp. SM1]|uniref:glycosyltransferase family 4 protein n=1 Tax=Cesiribacter sp. SM1 TaxID=2861196 RepID=UPI001CD4FCFF|nr:glycosyltransferase family 4 protein [Cesiribacter sp. SM1]
MEFASKKLAVIAPQIGALSETFIRKHMEALVPQNTCVIAATNDPPYAGNWDVMGPKLILKVSDFKSMFLPKISRAMVGVLSTNNYLQKKRANVFLKKNRPDVILGEYLNFSLLWWPMVKKLGIPMYAHAHGLDISVVLKDAEWRKRYLQLNEMSGVITMSKVSKEKLIDLGVDSDKIHVVPYGVDVPDIPVTREEIEEVNCLAVGRMITKKAPIFLLDAFRRAFEKNNHLRLDYIGTGPLLPAAQHYIKAFNLEHVVKFHEGMSREKVQAFFNRADIFLQHSVVDHVTGDEEGLPVSILEAMASALPVVSTRHAGIPEEVEEGITGFLVQEGDTVTMAQKINLLAADPELRQKIGLAGWQRAKQQFSWEKEKGDLLKILFS